MRARSSVNADPEMLAVVLGDREVVGAPSRPRLNHMRVVAAKPTPTLADLIDSMSLSPGDSSSGEQVASKPTPPSEVAPTAGPPHSGVSGDGPNSLGAVSGEHRPAEPSPVYTRMLSRPAGSLLAALQQSDAPSSSSSALLYFESRLPEWDESQQLLTLDYPPERANLASVQNFQLLPSWPRDDAVTVEQLDDDGEEVDSAFNATLVHGLIEETGSLETFSLDMRYPLSPLLAFAICLSAQDWE
jgi:hypothetical protein